MLLDFGDKRIGETVDLAWNCTNLLASGETISSASVTATVLSGTDPSPQNIVSGAATISGATVSQTITAGLEGVRYQLVLEITTSTGQIFETPARLYVTDVMK